MTKPLAERKCPHCKEIGGLEKKATSNVLVVCSKCKYEMPEWQITDEGEYILGEQT
jgi:Zn ribbon nucleic-acid-binding protein